MDLWQFVTADDIRIVDHCTVEIQEFLEELTAEALFKPETWKHLTAFVQVIPDGDILPTRGNYSPVSNDWQVAVNYLYADKAAPGSHALWFSLPDVAASILHTGRVPKIVDAFRIEFHSKMRGLTPVKLRGTVEIDPTNQDCFKVVIEERKLTSKRTDLSEVEKDRLDKAFKVLANATSYGIYAEMNPQETDAKVEVACHGIDAEPFRCRVAHPDVPGEYCFPPLASLITGGARLMLALLEHCVSTIGGTYAMEDTDSMAIVATKTGGLIPCPGGTHRTLDGQPAVKALSWKQVEEISERFTTLNPYDAKAIPGSILKIEDENYDPVTKKQRQLYCLAISAKRYALYLQDEKGSWAVLRKHNKKQHRSEHGLGHLLNPAEPHDTDRDWIGQVWLNILCRVLRLSSKKLTFENLPAIGRVTVSSPAAMRSLASLNDGKAYKDQMKPFNFALSCQVKQLGHPLHADPEHFHLIGPYELDSRLWLGMDWIDQYTGEPYEITTAGHHGDIRMARVKTYGELLREYEFHPEAKCADSDHNTCTRQTIGLLQRRQVLIDQIRYIGKESNSLEEVDAGLVHSAEDVYTEYCDPKRDEWTTKTLPALKKTPLAVLINETGLSRRALLNLRAGRSRPHSKNREVIIEVLKTLLAF